MNQRLLCNVFVRILVLIVPNFFICYLILDAIEIIKTFTKLKQIIDLKFIPLNFHLLYRIHV